MCGSPALDQRYVATARERYVAHQTNKIEACSAHRAGTNRAKIFLVEKQINLIFGSLILELVNLNHRRVLILFQKRMIREEPCFVILTMMETLTCFGLHLEPIKFGGMMEVMFGQLLEFQEIQ